MQELDIRWKQRFQNFENSFLLLKTAVEKTEYSEIERAGVIQIFEMTFELSWKMLKDFLNANDVEAKFPRDVIKEAFKYELIADGESWLDMLDKRNLLAHTYDDATARLALALIRENYFRFLAALYLTMSEK